MKHDTLVNEQTGDEFEVEFFGLNGEPITIEKWIRLFQVSDGLTDMVNGKLIRTVWTGIDMPDPMKMLHGFSYRQWKPNDPPLIYKTVVMDEDLDIVDAARYSTKQEAKEGHAAMIEKYKETK